MALSNRAQPWSKDGPDVVMWQVLRDLWDPKENPSGYVSLGLAENSLMHDDFTKYINTNTQIVPWNLTYGNGGNGTQSCRAALAHLFDRKFNPVVPVNTSHICVTNGVSTAIEHLATMLADPGDVFLLGQPYYGSFIADIELRPGVEVGRVPFGDTDPVSIEAVSAYASAIESCQRKGKKVAGLILCNPHNPLGRCYSRASIIELMKLCNKHKIHLIADEIYALSVFQQNPGDSPFTSLLSIPTEGLIDPALKHVVYGLSKDFGANGLRLGVIVSQHNPKLHDALIMVSLYSYASSLIEALTTKLLFDDEYMDWYITENHKRLKHHYEIVRTWAESHNITYKKGVCAAFFLWVDLGTVYKRSQAVSMNNNKSFPDMSQLPTQQGNQTNGDSSQLPDPLPTTGNPELVRADLSTTRSSPQNATQSAPDNGEVATDFTLDIAIEKALLQEKVFLASGVNFGSEKPGWVRIVFSQEEKVLREGLRRIERAMELDG